MIDYEVAFTRAYDVVVVGGGITGCCAALAAARCGASVAIVELNGFLGGIASAGFPWNAFYNYRENRLLVRGIPLEIVTALQAEGFASEQHLDPVMESLVSVNGAALKLKLSEMMRGAGVKVYYQSIANKAYMEDGAVRGAYIQNKQGCQLLRARVVVDATDSADIAAKSGARFVYGNALDGNKTQIASAAMTFSGVDMDKLISRIERQPEKVRPRQFSPEELRYVIRSLRDSPLSCIGTFGELIEQAKADGLPMPERTLLSCTIYPREGKINSVASKVIGVHPEDVDSFSQAELDVHAQVLTLYRFFREYVPGCEHIALEDVSHQIGIRETLHIEGEYCLTQEDLTRGTIFADAVALGSYIIDVHSPNHGGVDPCTDLPTYSIPYRSLIPREIDGLLVAGRCISATSAAMSAFRVIPIVGAIGQGAGTAAALSALRGIEPRALDRTLLRDTLVKAGCVVGIDRPINDGSSPDQGRI